MAKLALFRNLSEGVAYFQISDLIEVKVLYIG